MDTNTNDITSSDLIKFAEILEDVFLSTGEYSSAKGYFVDQMKYKESLYEEDTGTALEEFLEMVRYSHRDHIDPHTLDYSKFHITDYQELTSLLWITPLTDLPLYLNSENIYKRIISTWRLKVGK